MESVTIPESIASDISNACQELCGGNTDVPVAVRSSATADDLGNLSFAGRQETNLNATRLSDAPENCDVASHTT